MNKFSKIALAAGLPVAVVMTLGASPAGAATPPTTPGVPPTIPVGWQTLVDDTGTMSVAVPGEWVDMNTSPGSNDDGTPRPFIEASTSIVDFEASFDTPGVIMAAMPTSMGLQSALDASHVGDCTSETTAAFTSPTITGQLIHHVGCSGNGAEYLRMAGTSPVNPNVIIVVGVGIRSSAEAAVADTVLQSVAVSTGGAVAPTVPVATVPGGTTALPTIPTVPVATTGAAVTVPPTVATLPAVPTVPGAPTVPGIPTVPGATTAPGLTIATVDIVDDTGKIAVTVPATWTEVVTAPQTVDGVAEATIIASPNIDAFMASPSEVGAFTMPGVYYSAAPFTTDPSTLLLDRTQSCVGGTPQPYSDGVFTGLRVDYTNCGGTPTRVVSIAASPADSSFTSYLVVQITDAGPTGDAELNAILNSFNYNPAAIVGAVPTPTTVAGG